jgi:hypothetical protein
MRRHYFVLVRGTASNANTKWSSDQTTMRLDATPGCYKTAACQAMSLRVRFHGIFMSSRDSEASHYHRRVANW